MSLDHKLIFKSPYLRGPHYVHSSPLRALLARFLPSLKPNKFVPGQVFKFPDGSIICDPDTYMKYEEALKTRE